MRLVLGQDKPVADWVARQLGSNEENFFGPCTAIAVVGDDDEPLAGVVFAGYRPAYQSLEISMAAVSPRWARRGVIHALLAYPFEQLKCQRVQVTIPLGNKRAQRFCKGIGFVQEGVIRRGFGREHAVVMGMLRHEFDKLFARKNGQEIPQRARRA